MNENTEDKPDATAKCTIPPDGWYCTRAKGHTGPCAAWPIPEKESDPSATANDALSCPFCLEGDFDPIGLKAHLLRGYCEKFNETQNL